MQKWREIFQPYMKRPLVYMTFTRFMLGLTAVLVADYFLAPVVGRQIRGMIFIFAAFLFAGLAWAAYLRLDGIRLPWPLKLRINPAKKPSKTYGDMIDFVDERPGISFEDLSDEEKDFCILAANLFCFIIFFIFALIF